MKKVLVIGATGAIGRELTGELLSNPNVEKVITITRRKFEPSDAHKATADMSKLDERIVDMDKMETEAKGAYDGVDACFNTLGTTRAAAGSAAAFKKVDYEYVATSAQMAKQANVKHYALCSSAGANASLPSCDWGIFHGLLYAKTKGRAEQAVITQGFASTSIFRPGLLDRGGVERTSERIAKKFLHSTPVRTVARAMMLDAERRLSAKEAGVKTHAEREIDRFPGAADWGAGA